MKNNRPHGRIKRNKILALLLAFVMLLPCFSACGTPGRNAENTDRAEDTDGDTITSPTSSKTVDEAQLRVLAVKYADKVIGVQTGTVFDEVVNRYIPEATVEYYNSNADMALALKTGKISAYVADEPMARLLCQNYTDQYITGVFESCPYAYIYPKNKENSDTIRLQMNEFLAQLKSDGTMAELDDIWFGKDESLKVVDTSALTGENGTLIFAVSTSVGAPFVYIKDNAYAGYDVDIAVRFCKAYGYAIQISDSNPGGLFTSVSGGLADFGASSICVTEERKEVMNFSDPNYDGSVVLVTRDHDESDVSAVSDEVVFDVLKGKTVGTIKGSVEVSYIEEVMPDCRIAEYDTSDELSAALENGEIFAYVHEQPVVRQMLRKYQNHKVLGVLEKSDSAFIFQKGNRKGEKIRAEMNEFLAEITQNGTLEEIDRIWFEDDGLEHSIDLSELEGNNEVVKLAVCSQVAWPFAYVNYGQLCGYEVDIAFRFCRAYGYRLEIVDVPFVEIFEQVSSGECVMGASCITITEERKATFAFSDPSYNGGIVVVVKEDDEFDMSTLSDSAKLKAYDGKKVGYLSGTNIADVAAATLDNSGLVPFSDNDDVSQALEAGTIDAYLMDQPLARMQVKQYKNHHVYAVVSQDSYAYAFQKDSQLCRQMRSFIADLRASGTLETIDGIWFGDDAGRKTVDTAGLTGENGTLKFAVSTGVGEPFCYFDGENYLGYDVDIALRFCKEYGYALEINNYPDVNTALQAVQEGKCDFCGSCVTITAERSQVLDFSTPSYYGGIVMIVKGAEETEESPLKAFFSTLAISFQKTFIRERRWRLFVNGLLVTVLITVVSALFGSGFGFALYLLYRKEKTAVKVILDSIYRFMHMTPVVVILMVFYYLIFAKSGLGGVTVSIIAFTLMFACSVVNLLGAAVKAVDPGQFLAVRALGYRDTKGFVRMILPQTIPHFVPGFKGELVGLIKSTSIVSYVAVQDLTMVTDIVRARTYEAFFPLLVTAAIYFLFAWLLIKLVDKIEIRMNPCNRKESRILKGIEKK